MTTNKHIDKICCVILVFTFFISAFSLGIGAFNGINIINLGYENKLFDDSRVHTINIIMSDWDGFVAECENEEYVSCDVEIDGERFSNIGIRAKGNTSLSSVRQYGNNRYSFKLEFDKYENNFYYGLDKLSLNNLIQDNTYMKDYTVYTLMREFGVSAPLCSFAQIKVNGEVFGLYLAVEGIEDSFIQRNYGEDDVDLYKPDSMSMGGGKGNGREFSQADLEPFKEKSSEKPTESDKSTTEKRQDFSQGRFFDKGKQGDFPQGGFGGGGMRNGASDVLLQYTDDEFSSYRNIFDNAKTNITKN